MAGIITAAEIADAAMLHFVQTMVNPASTPLMQLVTLAGNPAFWFIIASALYWQGKENQSFYFMNVVLFSALAVGALKHFFARPRPDPAVFKRLALDIYTNLSFPSGHASIVSAYCAYLRHYVSRNKKLLLCLAVLVVGFSRVFLGAHFPTDVVAGIIFGVLVGEFSYFMREKITNKHFHPSKILESMAIAAILGVALIGLALLESIPLSGTLLGFYAGFFLAKQIDLRQPEQAARAKIVRTIFGFAVMGFILAMIPFVTAIQLPTHQQGFTRTFVMYGLAGFWVSFGLPWLEKGLRERFKS